MKLPQLIEHNGTVTFEWNTTPLDSANSIAGLYHPTKNQNSPLPVISQKAALDMFWARKHHRFF